MVPGREAEYVPGTAEPVTRIGGRGAGIAICTDMDFAQHLACTAGATTERGSMVYSRIGDVFAQAMAAVWPGLLAMLAWRRKPASP